MFTRHARMLVLAALAALAVPAHALADHSFTTSGSITYTWQGDPARGCAAEGLCDVQGALTLGSQGGGSSFTSGGPASSAIDIPLDTSGSLVRVADGPGAGDCVDAAATPEFGGDLLIAHRAGRLVGLLGQSLSSGRCAGPRLEDLARVALPVRRFGGRNASYDLHGTVSFTAGPFTGTLVSTLVVRSVPNQGGAETVSSAPPPPAPARMHRVLLERVTLRYRVAALPSALDATFSGEADPFCAALDSCGATGTLAFSLPSFQRTLLVQAQRTVARRVGTRQALSDFRRGRLRAQGGGTAPLVGRGIAQVAETFTQSAGLRCTDTADSDQPDLFLTARPARAGGGFSFALGDQFASGLLRTYCPGPSDGDVFGGSLTVARTSIGAAQLLARHSVVSLASPGGFAGFGYVASRGGALRFALTLEHVRAGTVEVTRP